MATNVRIHDASSGSSSKTRNKIQAILSSFMHEKDDFAKERYAERDITDSPGLLSMLCQPRNRENFYERVETFSPFTWPMKPLYLSPQHCALYGWENTDVDLLTCVSCKATLDGMVGTQWDLHTYNSTCTELRSSIINGHSKFCPWKETPCPESFLSLPAKTPQEWKTSFEDSCKNLLSLEGSLPVLQREAFQALVSILQATRYGDIPEIPEDVLSILSNSVTDSDSSSYHQDIIDTICVLGLCGWNTSNNSGIPVLCCSACHREAGLWNFHPLRNVTVLKNDNAQPCDAEAGVTGDDDGHSESQGMPCDAEVGVTGDNDGHSQSQGMPCDAEVGVTGDNDGHSESQGMPCDAEAGVTGDDDGHSTEPQGMMEDDISDSGSHIQPMDFGKDGGAKRNEETQRESVIMVCDIGIIRDKDSFKTEHYESENDGSKREHAGSQEVTMDSDEYTAGTEGEHKVPVTLDNLVQVNKKDQEVERLESQSCEENDSLNMESSKMSPLCGNISDEMQDENVVSEPFVSNDNDREISATKVEDSFQNTSDQYESHVESESQTEHSTLAEIRTQMPEQERSTLPSEDISLPQDIVAPEQGAVFRRTEEEPLAEEEHLQDKEPLQEKELSTEKESIRQYDPYEHVTEKDSLSKQEPISHEHLAQQNQRSVLDEDSQLPESDPPVEEEPTVEQGIGKESEVLSQPDTSGEEMRDVIDIRSQPPGFSENEDATDSDIPSDQGDDEQVPGTSTEPSRLFGAGSFFSPAHSRQDSLIVELGEDSMSERLQSIQSDLLDRGETASQMDSCRSLSEWSEGDVGEPSSKRLKTDGIEQIEFDVLAEHRNWCPWVTAVPSARDTSENVQKSPGWKILLEHLIQFTSPGKQPAAKQLQTPPTQVWKSVRRLFHDCQTTIMRNHMPSKVGR